MAGKEAFFSYTVLDAKKLFNNYDTPCGQEGGSTRFS